MILSGVEFLTFFILWAISWVLYGIYLIWRSNYFTCPRCGRGRLVFENSRDCKCIHCGDDFTFINPFEDEIFDLVSIKGDWKVVEIN